MYHKYTQLEDQKQGFDSYWNNDTANLHEKEKYLAAGMTESSFCLHLALIISGTTW